MSDIKVLPLIILLVYMAICVGIGIYAYRKQQASSSHEYLTGGGNVGFWVNGFAIFAAFATGGTMLGNIGLSYVGGWGYITAYNAGVAVGYLITAFFLAKVFRNMNVSTVPEFIKVRYSSKTLNIIVPLIVIGSLTAYLVAQMKVGGLIGERLFGIPYTWSVILIGIVYIFYTTYGGMRAVTLTDFIQGLMMIAVVLITGVMAISYGGGMGSLYEAAQEIKPDWTQSSTYPFSAYLGGFLVWASVIAILPHTVMRIFSAKDEKTGRASLSLGIGLYIITSILTIIFVIAVTIMITGGADLKDADSAFLIFLDEIVPEWMVGIAYAGIFAAVMSSVSAMLLALGAAFAYDLIGTIKPNYSDEKKRKLVPRSIMAFGVITLVLALNPPELLTLLYSAAMGLLASTLFFPAILGIWWKRMNRQGALVSAVGGAATYLILLWGFEMPPLSEITIALPVSLLLAIVVTLMTPAPTPKELRRVAIAHEREYTEMDEEGPY